MHCVVYTPQGSIAPNVPRQEVVGLTAQQKVPKLSYTFIAMKETENIVLFVMPGHVV
jgi:hypothetical protein